MVELGKRDNWDKPLCLGLMKIMIMESFMLEGKFFKDLIRKLRSCYKVQVLNWLVFRKV